MSSKHSSGRPPARHGLGGEFFVPAFLTIITLIYLVSAIQLGPPMKAGNMTASFFPIATAILILIALVCAMVHALRSRPAEAPSTAATGEKVENAETQDETPAGRQYAGLSLGAIGVIVLTAGYLLAFNLIGYFVSTFFYVLLLCCLFGGGFKQKWPTKLIAAVVITLAGYLMFEIAFQVRLPTLWSQ